MEKKKIPLVVWLVTVPLLCIAGLFIIIFATLDLTPPPEYTCYDGTIVNDPDSCADEPFCGDGMCNLNYNETCESCELDCGKCPQDCEIIYGSQFIDDVRVMDIKCIDNNGIHWVSPSDFCGGEYSIVPNQTHRQTRIMRESVACRDNRCIITRETVQNCGHFDTIKLRGVCATDMLTGLPRCYLYDLNGTYYGPRD